MSYSGGYSSGRGGGSNGYDYGRDSRNYSSGYSNGYDTYGLDIVVKFKALSYFVSQIDEARLWARSTFAIQGSNIPSFIIIILKIKY